MNKAIEILQEQIKDIEEVLREEDDIATLWLNRTDLQDIKQALAELKQDREEMRQMAIRAYS